jgi:hypothetical protein
MNKEKKDKQLLFSLSKEKGDFIVEFIRCKGNGGQKINKTSSGVRISHPESGVVVEAQEERTQSQNKINAFKKLVNNPKFKAWHKLKTSYALKGIMDMEREIQRKVDEAMKEENLKIEYFESKLSP